MNVTCLSAGFPISEAMGWLHWKVSVQYKVHTKDPVLWMRKRMCSSRVGKCVLNTNCLNWGPVYWAGKAELEGLCCLSHLISDPPVEELLIL